MVASGLVAVPVREPVVAEVVEPSVVVAGEVPANAKAEPLHRELMKRQEVQRGKVLAGQAVKRGKALAELIAMPKVCRCSPQSTLLGKCFACSKAQHPDRVGVVRGIRRGLAA
jgi:hypothetical protein